MALTRSNAADRARFEMPSSQVGYSGRNLELILLLLTSAVLAAGLWLLLLAQFREMEIPGDGNPGGRPLNLNEARSSDELFPLFGFFVDPKDREFAALRILAFLREREGIESVNALQAIKITSAQINGVSGLRSFSERLIKLRQDGKENIPIPLLTSAQIGQLRPLASVRDAESYRRKVFSYGIVFAAGFFLVHAAWRVRRFGGDQLLLPAAYILSSLGFLMMARLRDPLRDALLFPDFAIGVGIGCILTFLASLPNYERSPLRRLAYIPLMLSFLLSLALIVFGSGPGLSDAKINLRIGAMQFQPVEAIKLLLLFFFAGFFADRWELLRALKQSPRTLPRILRDLDIPILRYTAPLIIAVGIAIAFFFLAKDLGPALVMALLFVTLYSTARSRATGALVACLALAAAVWIGYQFHVPRTVSSRLSMWLSPWDNYVTVGGDHLAQSFWSFSTGGFWGSGLGLGSPGSVPAVHTDLVLAAIGEELGFVGLVCAWLAFAVIVHRALRISLCSSGAYSLFLGVSAALLIGLQATFISAGILGIIPLSGVVTPFVNYGKSSTLANFLLLGILVSISRNPSDARQNEPFRKPLLWLGGIFAAIGVLIFAQAARVQIFQDSYFMGRGALILQADGHRRYTYNPRLLEAAQTIPRGSILDRNGIPLATDSVKLLESFRAQYGQMHVDLKQVIRPGTGRIYPFGALAFHLLGDLVSRLNWGASNTSYIERDLDVLLQGYDDRAIVVKVSDKPFGREHPVVLRDLQELAPLARYRYKSDETRTKEILNNSRDVRLSIDIRLQDRVASILERHVLAAGTKYGAAVVIDPATGDLLASVTYPFADIAKAESLVSKSEDIPENSKLQQSLLDRARYGLYPPGSAFKLVTAIAALDARLDADATVFECKRLSDGRIGNYVRGWGKPIRDDQSDEDPHGKVDMAKGLTVSCNAYFAQLGTYLVGADRLLRAADFFGIHAASPNTASQLKDALPQASYGQGQVVASPLQMARVAGVIANNGQAVSTRIVLGEAQQSPRMCLPEIQATKLSKYMRRVVMEGTGQQASRSVVAIAGKTGTAEVQNHPAHAWFVGFAPCDTPAKKIAFAVLIENGRYGGRIAAPAAAEIADAAVELGLIRRE